MIVSTGRLEAFSDGVIAIIITVMVFDLKIEESLAIDQVNRTLLSMVPRFLSYVLSFVMLAIMWVHHHQLFHSIQRTDATLIWLNMLLLFGMSLIPFGTHFLGEYPGLGQANGIYAFLFLLISLAFTAIRSHVIRAGLLKDEGDATRYQRAVRRNQLALGLYLLAGLASFWTPWISYAVFALVPGMYLITTFSRPRPVASPPIQTNNP